MSNLNGIPVHETIQAMYTTFWKRNAASAGLMLSSIVAPAWAGYVPSARQAPTISWFACPDSDSTQCAFFDVPMNYSNPDNNKTVSIFMRKLPAKVSAEQRLGSLFLNPGGPGGSGSVAVIESGDELSTVLEGRYDIIGFDPRGVNLTGPSTSCFDTEAKFLQRDYQRFLIGAPFPSKGNQLAHVTHLAALQSGHQAACAKNGNQDMLRSVGTVAVARDIISMADALGENGINYLGYSYGTILGSTLAALRPDLIRRMVLDGVADAEAYFTDVLQWGRAGTTDTHKTLTGFFITCIEAGPEYCSLAVPKDGSKTPETVESLRKRLDAIYSRLSNQPLTIADSPAGSGVLRATDLQQVVLGALTSPGGWSELAKALTDVEQGNGVSAYSSLYSSYATIYPRPYNDNPFNRSIQILGTREPITPILCGDSPLSNISLKDYMHYFQEMGKLSPVGEQWALVPGTCLGWPYRATERYTGPWTVEGGLNKTQFPILFVSQDADPVTPLSAAIKMSQGFGNESATLLIQHGYGHTSRAHPSLCTIKIIRDYFLDGKVPPNGTRCDPEPGYIYPANNTISERSVAAEDEDVLQTLKKLRNVSSKLVRRGF